MSGDEGVEYRPIEGFRFYRVGSDGSVWGCQKCGRGAGRIGPWRRLCPSNGGKGYQLVKLREGGQQRNEYVHVLVLEAFVGPRPEGMEACHDPNPDRTCNRLDNLRWDTPSANNHDKDAHGTSNKGENHYQAKRRRLAMLAD
jgi:hypothetical protein